MNLPTLTISLVLFFTNVYGDPPFQAIAYENQSLNISIPECPLAPNSVIITSNSNIKHFSEWQAEDQNEAYDLIQKIIQVWAKEGMVNYLIYGKESEDSKTPFHWEIIPFSENGWRFWKQFKVLWNSTFESSCLSRSQQEQLAQDFQKKLLSFTASSTTFPVAASVNTYDAFSNPQVIEEQRVFEGNEVDILYDFSPIVLGGRKLHFLVIPKKQHERFSDLTKTEYAEAMTLTQKLIAFYKTQGYKTAYMLNKNGIEAGQTVPHWHEHVIFTATQSQDYFGRLNILKNMIFGGSRLPKDELQKEIKTLRQELSGILNPS